MDQKTQKSFEEFTAVIQDLTAVVADIGKVEDAKARAAAEKHHQLLDGYIQREQAQILRLRGLEQHRIQLAETLGWNSLTFRQILERAPQEQVTRRLPVSLSTIGHPFRAVQPAPSGIKNLVNPSRSVPAAQNDIALKHFPLDHILENGLPS